MRISKNNARIIRNGLVCGRKDGLNYGTMSGVYNLVQFWGFGISSREMEIGWHAYDKAYNQAYKEKVASLSKEEVEELHYQNKLCKMDERDREIALLKRKVKALETQNNH